MNAFEVTALVQAHEQLQHFETEIDKFSVMPIEPDQQRMLAYLIRCKCEQLFVLMELSRQSRKAQIEAN